MRTDSGRGNSQPTTLTHLNAPFVVHQAAGVLKVRQQISIDEAYRVLSQAADQEGRDPEEFAWGVINSLAGGTR